MNMKKAVGRVSFSGFKLWAEATPRGIRLSLSDCIGVRELCPELAVLVTKRGSVRVEGRGLDLTVYENRQVELSGQITSISLCIAKGSGRV